MSIPPLIPGESTTGFSTVNKRLNVFGDLTMYNTASTLEVSGNTVLGRVTMSNLNLTNATTTSQNVTGSTIVGLAVTNEVSSRTSVSTLIITGTAANTGLRIKEGAGGKQGIDTLVGGTKSVACTSVTTDSRIFLTKRNLGTVVGSIGTLAVASITPSVSFLVVSGVPTDDATFSYLVSEPAV